ncbi:hypothetical protein [Domibacillus tundrae]|uniref:hypothetical protein n=1 Tax=Domibacillus tundrae TaxID=1587527 RepID=UPI000617DB01|nr:hypothetical protein [Domibacillus tundrae]
MNNGHSSYSIFEIFLGFLTGVVWLLLPTSGIISDFVVLLDIGSIGTILNIIIAIVGFLAFLLFGICIFKRMWRYCFK